MASSLSRVYLHIVWGTYDRLPLITPVVQRRLYETILQESRRMRIGVLAIGGIEDHIHLLVEFPTTVLIADFVKQLKGYSSRCHNAKEHDEYFRWQSCFGCISVSPRDRAIVIRYIQNQRSHHESGRLLTSLEATQSTITNSVLDNHTEAPESPSAQRVLSSP